MSSGAARGNVAQPDSSAAQPESRVAQPESRVGEAGSAVAATSVDLEAIRWDVAALVPVIVQDVADGRVLMLAWADREALEATLATGDVHFHSRSRDAMWRKGETSGNVLRLVRLEVDCDGDALLATVEPTGPTCHRGSRSCFDLEGAIETPRDAPTAPGARAGQPTDGPGQPQGFAWLETLSATIAERARLRPAGSYTTSLLEGGVDAAARKVAEEATEVVLAAKDDAAAEGSRFDRAATRAALAGEAADLLYHLLVVLAERAVEPRDVIDVLQDRHRT
jgi:phosphoribosyl-ATP pyrophosphohydrolase/phosphoribosyl-AMP cyclohydrolase